MGGPLGDPRLWTALLQQGSLSVGKNFGLAKDPAARTSDLLYMLGPLHVTTQ